MNEKGTYRSMAGKRFEEGHLRTVIALQQQAETRVQREGVSREEAGDAAID